MTEQNNWWDEIEEQLLKTGGIKSPMFAQFKIDRQQHEKEMLELKVKLIEEMRNGHFDIIKDMVRLDDVLKVFNGLIGHREYRKLFERELKALSNQSHNSSTNELTQGSTNISKDFLNGNPVLCKCGHKKGRHTEMGCYVDIFKEGNYIGYCLCEKFEPMESAVNN